MVMERSADAPLSISTNLADVPRNGRMDPHRTSYLEGAITLAPWIVRRWWKTRLLLASRHPSSGRSYDTSFYSTSEAWKRCTSPVRPQGTRMALSASSTLSVCRQSLDNVSAPRFAFASLSLPLENCSLNEGFCVVVQIMDRNNEDGDTEAAAMSEYVFVGTFTQVHIQATCANVSSGAIVQGLPKRSLLKSEGKYFIRVNIDGEKWESPYIRTRGSMLMWYEGDDKRKLCVNCLCLKC
ncbi:hypothetical protein CALVIDRAFT_284840 [Calocera viscosa TUFC12733]|uniref:Uncharacterized protein n=1 Tax=Calocera viscosa (strain TUFC12733) TaxID=1330018 RepID=A0A167IUJ4_CALVF|nr:hypothetical protein CALVIDRAFT_284840 [Calocera viscosa TUFC12733]